MGVDHLFVKTGLKMGMAVLQFVFKMKYMYRALGVEIWKFSIWNEYG